MTNMRRSGNVLEIKDCVGFESISGSCLYPECEVTEDGASFPRRGAKYMDGLVHRALFVRRGETNLPGLSECAWPGIYRSKYTLNV